MYGECDKNICCLDHIYQHGLYCDIVEDFVESIEECPCMKEVQDDSRTQ